MQTWKETEAEMIDDLKVAPSSSDRLYGLIYLAAVEAKQLAAYEDAVLLLTISRKYAPSGALEGLDMHMQDCMQQLRQPG